MASTTSTTTQASTPATPTQASTPSSPSASTSPSASQDTSAASPQATGLQAFPADVANTALAGVQTIRAIGAVDGGGYAVAWMSQDSTGAKGLYVQRYDANGAKSGSETHVNYTVGAQDAPAIAVLHDGSIVLGSVASQTVFMRRFDANGNATGGDVAVAQSADTLAQPVLLALDDGGVAAGWASVQQTSTGSTTAQHVQRFDAQLRPVGAQQDFAPTDANHNVSLKLVAQPGGFVAGVTHRFQGISYVQFRIGTRDVGPVDDANAGLPEFNTTLTPLADGSYILWSTGSSGGYMQRLDGAGRAVGSAVSIPVVPETAVGLADGGWVTVVRQLYGAPSLAQRYDSTGAAVGPAVEMVEGMSRPLAVSNVGNGFALAWSFTGALGDSDIRTQRVDAK
jgi:hypothetical protein